MGAKGRLKPRALILGGLAGQVDAIRSLQSLGWEVHACGLDARGPAVAVADDFHIVDIVDVDAVTSLAAEIGVQFVYSVGSDIAMPTVSRVSERLGLPTFIDSSTADLLRDKAALRGFLAEHDLSPVAHRRVTEAADLATPSPYPAMLKPVDSQGQRGIMKVCDQEGALAALPAALAASHSGVAILEEFLEGPEISVHVFLRDGRIALCEPSDRHVWDGPIPGVAQGHTMPSQWLVERDVAVQLNRLLIDFVKALGVQNGPLYFQLKLTPLGPRIIEVAPRLDGCHLWRLIHILYDIDLLHACWAGLGGSEIPPLVRQENNFVGELIFHLVTPEHVVDRKALSGRVDGDVVFEEFHLDKDGLARDTNGIVARAGYRILTRKAADS